MLTRDRYIFILRRMGREVPQILYVGDRESFFSREVLRGVFSMRTEGCDWHYWCLSSEVELEQVRESIKGGRVDGMLVRGLEESRAREFAQLGVPTVFIRSTEGKYAHYINGPHPDDRAIGRLAGEEFGYLNLDYWGFVHWKEVMWSEERKNTFHAYAESLGVKNEVLSLTKEERRDVVCVTQIAAWLKKLPKPCGVLACSDKAGLDVLHACRLLGLSVPDEVAVIGVDNDRLFCESASPALTSIDLKAADLGRAAVVQLGKMLGVLDADVEVPQTPAELVSRESTQRKDRHKIIYQRAMDYIEARPLSQLSVVVLASKCGISRRGLERAFSKCKADSPAAVIRQKRMVAIEVLLKDKTASLESVAHQAGFSDASSFSNFVKRMTDKSPGELRGK